MADYGISVTVATRTIGQRRARGSAIPGRYATIVVGDGDAVESRLSLVPNWVIAKSDLSQVT
ncbi:hypothetical protein [Sphingomonas sp.]|uniref:hypothetical protein n=1 Tax=Sphingomonas sp. TaxID=28214 RepID=UPI003B0044FF